MVASKHPEQAQPKMERKMVPDSVMTSVLTELVQYVGEKGKFKTKTRRSKKSARKEPYPTGLVTSPKSECMSIKEESNSPGDYLPNGDLSTLTSPETRCSSVSSITPSVVKIPSAADMNMVAPPNVVVPPITLTLSGHYLVTHIPLDTSDCSKESDGLSSPKESESGGYFDISASASPEMSPPSSNENTYPVSSLISPVSTSSGTNKNSFVTPNKIAPPSEPISFDIISKRPLQEPVQVVIPQNQNQNQKPASPDHTQQYQTTKYSLPASSQGEPGQNDSSSLYDMRFTNMGRPPVPGLTSDVRHSYQHSTSTAAITPPGPYSHTAMVSYPEGSLPTAVRYSEGSLPTAVRYSAVSEPKSDSYPEASHPKPVSYLTTVEQSFTYPSYPRFPESYQEAHDQMPANAYHGHTNTHFYNPYSMDKPSP